MSKKLCLTLYNNDVLAESESITRVVKDGVARYNNQNYMVHTHHGVPSINTADPIRTSIDLFPDDEIIQQAKNILYKRSVRGCFLESPSAVRDLCIMELAKETSEVFCLIHLDNKHRVLAFQRLFYGTINSSAVHIRPILASILNHNSAACLAVHNHPSSSELSDLEPSRADIDITKRIKTALDYTDCRLLDHLIVGSGYSISLAERGEM